MRTLKYTFLGIGIQVILFIVVGLVGDLFFYGADPVGKLFWMYSPVFALVAHVLLDDNVHGDARMIGPIIIGIPIGVILYGFLIGLAIRFFRRSRKALPV